MDTILIRGRDIKYWILEPTIGTYGSSKKAKVKPSTSPYKPPLGYKVKAKPSASPYKAHQRCAESNIET